MDPSGYSHMRGFIFPVRLAIFRHARRSMMQTANCFKVMRRLAMPQPSWKPLSRGRWIIAMARGLNRDPGSGVRNHGTPHQGRAEKRLCPLGPLAPKLGMTRVAMLTVWRSSAGAPGNRKRLQKFPKLQKPKNPKNPSQRGAEQSPAILR